MSFSRARTRVGCRAPWCCLPLLGLPLQRGVRVRVCPLRLFLSSPSFACCTRVSGYISPSHFPFQSCIFCLLLAVNAVPCTVIQITASLNMLARFLSSPPLVVLLVVCETASLFRRCVFSALKVYRQRALAGRFGFPVANICDGSMQTHSRAGAAPLCSCIFVPRFCFIRAIARACCC